MPSFRLRPARPGGAATIARLHVQSWRETYPGIVPDAYLRGLSVPDRERAWQGMLSRGESDLPASTSWPRSGGRAWPASPRAGRSATGTP